MIRVNQITELFETVTVSDVVTELLKGLLGTPDDAGNPRDARVIVRYDREHAPYLVGILTEGSDARFLVSEGDHPERLQPLKMFLIVLHPLLGGTKSAVCSLEGDEILVGAVVSALEIAFPGIGERHDELGDFYHLLSCADPRATLTNAQRLSQNPIAL